MKTHMLVGKGRREMLSLVGLLWLEPRSGIDWLRPNLVFDQPFNPRSVKPRREPRISLGSRHKLIEPRDTCPGEDVGNLNPSRID